MPDVHQRIRLNNLVLTGKKAQEPLDLQTGMPALDSIYDDKVRFKPTLKGHTYRILKTTEVDAYDATPTALALTNALRGKRVPVPAAIAAAVRHKPFAGDDFAGSDRKAARLSIATSPIQKFSDVASLVASLPPMQRMMALKIPLGPTSGRSGAEQRNIRVTGFLYAAIRKADNDFQLIVGRNPKAAPETYMIMVVSGLPPDSYPAFGALNTARSAYKKFFGGNLPGAVYDFYQPPIPVQIDGSLFFNASHSLGQWPGPPSLKSRMPTIWHVHPISGIKLGT